MPPDGPRRPRQHGVRRLRQPVGGDEGGAARPAALGGARALPPGGRPRGHAVLRGGGDAEPLPRRGARARRARCRRARGARGARQRRRRRDEKVRLRRAVQPRARVRVERGADDERNRRRGRRRPPRDEPRRGGDHQRRRPPHPARRPPAPPARRRAAAARPLLAAWRDDGADEEAVRCPRPPTCASAPRARAWPTRSARSTMAPGSPPARAPVGGHAGQGRRVGRRGGEHAGRREAEGQGPARQGREPPCPRSARRAAREQRQRPRQVAPQRGAGNELRRRSPSALHL